MRQRLCDFCPYICTRSHEPNQVVLNRRRQHVRASSIRGGPPEYSAAIAGVAACSPPTSAAAILAVFNLTVHIKNPSGLSTACVWSDATAVVSYGGATIGAGVVPWLCAGKEEEREVAAPVWGVGAGADVTLPRALQSRGAVVDVAVRMPRGNVCLSYAQVLSCSVRVGGGPSLCTSACD
ncbi:hypothetical protein HU200_032489 [Digitaria exilis]|uniref:Late embryogenesis abundant protein LEA-2 subgroup domain-containing protein n=1 Tax=Digitaria exilis TaxID=1010633 RepID=A0A835EPB7_9POAL|nr:hypothetical protein HU200_032489 [Digitaria exilis]